MMKQVLIVGGGSAGWITAAYMDSKLNGNGQKTVDVKVIESASIGRVGVGEATIPTIKETLEAIGIDEITFLKETSATFKNGILFKDWAHIGNEYFHPFDRYQNNNYFDKSGSNWLNSDRTIPFANTVSAQPALALEGFSPKNTEQNSYESALSYAYHMDAEAFADYLAKLATGRGVTQIIDTVIDVGIDESGNISYVEGQESGRQTANLYIDCTGFASILSMKAQQGTFIDHSDHLLCDRAVTMRLPYEDGKELDVKPYTISTAMPSGWRWDIGLQHRRGVGYVYSSQFISDQEAEKELREAIGSSCQGIQARHLKFRVGHLEKPWNGNCVAIGLSAGFLEPLESTGLYLIEFAAKILYEHFPLTDDYSALAQSFNTIMTRQYEELISFVTMHYSLSKRTDSAFWRAATDPKRMPDLLREKLNLFNEKLPSAADFTNTLQVFSSQNYEYIMYGMGWSPAHIEDDPTRQNKPTQIPSIITTGKTEMQQEVISHKEWLQHLKWLKGREQRGQQNLYSDLTKDKMEEIFELNSKITGKFVTVDNKFPILMFDNFYTNPDLVRAFALDQSYSVQEKIYPGVQHILNSKNETIAALMEKFRSIVNTYYLPRLPVTKNGKKISEIKAVETDFSLLTTKPEDLSPRQRQPHVDAVPIAGLVYLNKRERGGTLFFNENPKKQLNNDANPSEGYFTETTDSWEKIHEIEGIYNRFVVYPGFVHHSGNIQGDWIKEGPSNKLARLTQRIMFFE